MKILIASFLLINSFNLIAKDLINIGIIESAQNLPSKVWGFGYLRSQSTFKYQFNEYGNKTALADTLYKEFTFQDLLDEELDQTKRIKAEGAFSAFDIEDLNTLAGSHIGDMDVQTKVENIFLSFGVNSKLSLFAILPIITTNINFDNEFKKSDELESLINRLKDEGHMTQVREIEDKLSNPILWQLREYSYDEFYPQTVKDLGDLRLMSRYSFYTNDFFTSTLSLNSTIPTGRKNDVNQFINLFYSDNQFDVGLESLNQLKIASNNRLTFSFERSFQIGNHQKIRIPLKSGDLISPDIDENTFVDYGDISKFQIQDTHNLTDYLSISAGYRYQTKGSDRYKGKKFQQQRYTYLEENSRAMMQSVFAGISLNTINWFLNKKFLIPIDLSIVYSHQFDGINVNSSNEFSVNLLSFYKKI